MIAHLSGMIGLAFVTFSFRQACRGSLFYQRVVAAIFLACLTLMFCFTILVFVPALLEAPLIGVPTWCWGLLAFASVLFSVCTAWRYVGPTTLPFNAWRIPSGSKS